MVDLYLSYAIGMVEKRMPGQFPVASYPDLVTMLCALNFNK